MPHNLYLHTSLVQTRASDTSPAGKRQAIKYNTIDTLIALGLAFFVNAAILVVAAAAFHFKGYTHVEELQDAHKLLTPLLGTGLASAAFAIALLASGQSSTITGTLAGQIVMEGFLNIRVRPWVRRLVTRALAIIPAIFLIWYTGGKDTLDLLIYSQIVLSMQLSFAVFPLLMFTGDKKRMGEFVSPPWMQAVGYIMGLGIALANVYLLYQSMSLLWLLLTAAVMLTFSLWATFIYKEKPRPLTTKGTI